MHAPSGEKSFAPCLVCLWFTHSLFLPPSHSDLLATRACTLSPSRPGSLCTTAGPWQSNFASPDPPLQGSARGNTRKFAALLLPLLLGAIRVKPNSPSWIITVRVVETLMMTMRVMMPWACPGLTQMMMIFLLERMIVEMTVTSHSMTLGVNETFFFFLLSSLFFFLFDVILQTFVNPTSCFVLQSWWHKRTVLGRWGVSDVATVSSVSP